MRLRPLLPNLYYLIITKYIYISMVFIALPMGLIAQTLPQVILPSDSDPDYDKKKKELIRNTVDTTNTKAIPKITSAVNACFEPFSQGTDGWTLVPRNDDGSLGPISLGWNFSLYGTIYNSVYINTNGNISFTGGVSQYSPAGFPINRPMIAAFWADVDTRVAGSGAIYYKVFPNRLVVTWDHVGYYNQQNDKTNTFQLIIYANTSPNFTGNDVIFAYGDMQWTTGSASNGVGGFGGYPATVGANHGNGINYIQTGRFNINSSQPPNIGGVGTPGGVSWLDDKCIGYVVRGYEGNISPAVAGWPANDSISVYTGQTLIYNFQFSGPEVDQNVSVDYNLGSICNTTINVSDNNTSNPNVALTISGDNCNLGQHNISITATDNGQPVATSTFALEINVVPCPTPAPAVSDTVICYNSSAVLTASACIGTYKWYENAEGGTPLSEIATYTTPTLTADKTYYVACNDGICESSRSALEVLINLPPIAANKTICDGNTVTLTATGCHETFRWFSSNTSTVILASTASYTTPVLNATKTYYVSCYINNCESSRLDVVVTVTPNPAMPSATSPTICAGNTTTLTASGCSGNYKWYGSATGLSILSNTGSYTTPTLNATASYYVSCTVNNCESTRRQVTVTVNPIPPVPNASGTAICEGKSTTLTASGCSGNYKWYASNTSTNVLANSGSYTTPALAVTTIYYVSCTVTNCESSRKQVTVLVNSNPTSPSSNGLTVCSGNAATLTASGCLGTFQWYASASGTTVLSNTFSYTTPPLTVATSYFVSCKDINCESSRTQINIIVNANPTAPAAPGTTICAGSTATLTSSGCSGTYRWYSSATSTAILASTVSYTTPALNATTSYYASCRVNNCESTRTQSTVTVTPLPAAPVAPGTTICAGNTATLTASGCSGTYRWYSSATSTVILASTASYTTSVLNTNTIYYASCTVNNCQSTRTPSTVTVNPIPSAPTAPGTTTCAGSTGTLTASGCSGTYRWYASATGTTILASTASYITPALNVNTTYYVSCTVSNCQSTKTPSTVTVNPIPSAPAAPAVATCVSNTAILTASGCSGTYRWYASNTSTAILASAATYTTPVLTVNTSYYASCRVNNCESSRTQANVTVNPNPSAPNAPVVATCAGSSATLTASGCSGTYRWYSSNTSTAILASASTYATPPLAVTTNYYVTCNVNNCESTRTQTTATVNTIPGTPTAPGTTICAGKTTILTASGCSGTYRWYGSATGTAILVSTAAYTTPTLTTTTSYFVSCRVNNCESSRTLAMVTVTPLPSAPTSSGATICAGNTATLTASGCSGTYNWYASNTGTTILSSNASYTTPVLNTSTNYFVSCTANNCEGNRAQVTATVNPIPTAPVAPGVSGCVGSSSTLTASGCSGTFRWYSSNTGTVILASTPDYTTPTLNTTANYFVSCRVNNCESSRTQATVTVFPIPLVPTSSGVTICAGSTATLAASGCSGTYRWYSSNTSTVILASAATYTSPTLATTTSYFVSCRVNNCESGRAQAIITVNPIPSTPTASGITICAGSTATLTASGCSGTYRWYSSTTSTAILASASTYTTPALNTNTNYYVSCRVNNCESSRFPITVVVTPIPSIPTASGATICTGSTTTLTASGCAAGAYRWYSSTTSTTVLVSTADYTTPALNTTTSYFVSCRVNNCESSRRAVSITVNPIPTAPIAAGITICPGTTASLSASGCSGTVRWYSSNTTTIILASAATYTTPALSINTNYYVSCTVNNCISNRTSVTVSVVPATLSLTGNAANGVRQATETINSTQTLNAEINAMYKAGKGITLNPGFFADSSSVFLAKIEACN